MDNIVNKDEALPGGDNPQSAPEGGEGGNPTPVEKRHSEQMEGAKKEVEKYKNTALDVAVKGVAKNAELLLEIHEQDPDLANEIAKRFKYPSFDEASKFITPGQKLDPKDELEDEATRFEKMYTQKRTQEKHQEALVKAESLISKLPDDLQEAAANYFKEITDGKTLTEDKAIEFAKMATLYVSKDRLLHDKMEDGLKYLGSSGITGSGKPKKEEEPQTIIRNGKIVVLQPKNKA